MRGSYTVGNSDDITKAVEGLDTFTKNWCMNCAETDRQNALVFRCKECEFHDVNKYCIVKRFANNHDHDYPMDGFGSMGSL
jgi:hypothetical protein